MSKPIRLSKRLIELTRCSRSEAEKYIEGGWVLVDGEIVDEPQFKVEAQQVELHPKATLTPIARMTILLHLPSGFDANNPDAALQLITPKTRTADNSSDTSADSIRTLKRHFSRLKPTAPLEAGATGLLVFSQDGRVVRRLVDESNRNEQEYIVTVSGDIAAGGIEQLNGSMKFNGYPLPTVKVSWQNETRLRFALKSVRSGQIEFMCGRVGLTVKAMKRIRIGRVSMAKLPPGEWRYLPSGTLF